MKQRYKKLYFALSIYIEQVRNERSIKQIQFYSKVISKKIDF